MTRRQMLEFIIEHSGYSPELVQALRHAAGYGAEVEEYVPTEFDLEYARWLLSDPGVSDE